MNSISGQGGSGRARGAWLRPPVRGSMGLGQSGMRKEGGLGHPGSVGRRVKTNRIRIVIRQHPIDKPYPHTDHWEVIQGTQRVLE